MPHSALGISFLSCANEGIAIDKGLRGQWNTVLGEETSHWWSIEFHQWVERKGISRWCWVSPPGYPLTCCWALVFKPHRSSLKWIRCFPVRTKTVKPWTKVMFSNFLALNQPVISYLWCQVTNGKIGKLEFYKLNFVVEIILFRKKDWSPTILPRTSSALQ